MPKRSSRLPRIWFETGDLFVHFGWNLHPTGIQRVGLEILRAAREKYRDRVAFCRWSHFTGHFEPLDWSDIEGTVAAPDFGEPATRWLERPVAVSRQVRRFLGRIPKIVLLDYLHGRARERDFADRVVPGDIVVCLGLPWNNPNYGRAIGAAKRRYGFRFALIVNDVIPFTDPELCQKYFAAAFRHWFENVIGVCDGILVSSKFAGSEIAKLCRQRGWPLAPLIRIRFGAGFTVQEATKKQTMTWPDRFVLFVSSIERRKNHSLLLRVWRLLLQRHGPDKVPSLIFVGVGGDVGKVLREFREDATLRGKVTMIRGASDGVVHEAYRRCLFTVYPSLTEGWGLPVGESIDFGKLCIAANRASLPEVGGHLVDYFDPSDDADALAAIERALFEPGYLAARMAQIARDYRRPTWEECATMLVDQIDALDQAALPVDAAEPAVPG